MLDNVLKRPICWFSQRSYINFKFKTINILILMLVSMNFAHAVTVINNARIRVDSNDEVTVDEISASNMQLFGSSGSTVTDAPYLNGWAHTSGNAVWRDTNNNVGLRIDSSGCDVEQGNALISSNASRSSSLVLSGDSTLGSSLRSLYGTGTTSIDPIIVCSSSNRDFEIDGRVIIATNIPGVTVTTTDSTTSEAGDTATFNVVLDTIPSADVTISVTSSDDDEGIPTETELTFTTENWDTAQTVTITGQNDDIDDGTVSYSIVLGTTSSTDANYDGTIDPADVSLTNSDDDDTAGITVNPTTGLTTTEAGSQASFTVVLDSEPTADVTIPVASNNTDEGTVDVTELTFTAENWDDAQTVTITGVNDDVDDANQNYNIVLSTASDSADTLYAAINPTDVSVTNEDDDTVGIIVNPSTGLTTTEAGGQASFTVVLNSEPTADVTIPVASANSDEGTIVVTELTFTAENWDDAQTVTITGVNDDVDDNDQSYSITLDAPAASSDSLYAAINPDDVAVTNTDDDTAGVTVTPSSGLITTETAGIQASFTVVLNSEPTADVTIPVASDNTDEGTVDVTELTFTAENWNDAQTVTITGVDDDIDDDNQDYSVILSTPTDSSDTLYAVLNPDDVLLTNVDDDTAIITVIPTSGLTTTEAGGSATFFVILSTQPTADVTIPVNSDNTAEGTLGITELVFTTTNWDTIQSVVVTGVDDDLDDGDQTYTVFLNQPTGSDTQYTALDPDDVLLTNSDNDTSGITVDPATGLTTTEGGVIDDFTVVLDSQPTADVTIPIASENTSEGTIEITELMFTTENWDTPQTVTVTGVDDDVSDGNQSYNIILTSPTSSDSLYADLSDITVEVLNSDNDTVGITVNPSSGLTTTEAGDSADFTVLLNSEPSADVMIPLASNNTNEGTLALTELMFTTENWDTPQTVTITGVDDAIDDGDQIYTIVLDTPTSSDATYAVLDPADVEVTNSDDDTVGITVDPVSGLTTTEAGDTTDFTVVLDSEPTADVVIPIASDNTNEGTITITELTFTTENWDTPQTVTITGVDDAVDDSDQTYNIVLSPPTSSDSLYSALDPADVEVTNSDDDTARVIVAPTSGLTTTEAGGTADFTVVLNSQPTTDVTIPIASDNTAEGLIAITQLVFTTTNWDQPQTVTVTGVDDTIMDEDQNYTIILSSAFSNSSDYSGVDPDDVSVTNINDDFADPIFDNQFED